MMRRSNEPWFVEAVAAAEKADTGDRSLETMLGYLPFLYGRWDDAAQTHALVGMSEGSRAARDGFYAAGTFQPEITRAALHAITAPVLIYAGESDVSPTPEVARDCAHLFPNADVAVQPGAGHFPWLDDAAEFSSAIESFLS